MTIIKVGTRVEGVWGMGIANDIGTVVSFADDNKERAIIKFDESPYDDDSGRTLHIRTNEIREKGYRSPNGSPIGVYLYE